MPERFLGIDTSNYRTSAAIYNAETGEWVNRGGLLTVPEGAIGLRQSDALFQHTVRLHEKIGSLPSGEVRAIGVSNFKPHHLEPLMDAADILPMVDQIELHPGCNQEVTRDFCNRHDIVVEAWSPLGSGRVLENQLLIDIAASYGCTVAQLCLRWCLQRRAIPLPKSTDPSRIAENARIFWFNITDEDLQRIDELDPLGQSGLDPDAIDF